MEDPNKSHKHHHHILSNKEAIGVFVSLLVLTVFTVWIAHVDLGALNFPVAMIVASVKALLVMLIFMGLKYDRRENAVIFFTSFLFLVIFIVFTASDVFFRGDVYVKPGDGIVANAKSRFKKAWIPTPELVAHGKGLFVAQCTSCHGDSGRGDGPAAGALNPPPRNFTVDAGWKNGRKPSQIFKTLKEGLNAMPNFQSLPAEDRWAIAHYVETLGPSVLKDETSDLAKIGVDPNKESSGGDENKTIPIEFAIERLADEARR